jgi:hypothetical protein
LEALAQSEFAYANRAEEVRAAQAVMAAEDKEEETGEMQPPKQCGSNLHHEAGPARQSERLKDLLTPEAGLRTDQARAIYGKLMQDGYYVWENAFRNTAELMVEAEQAYARNQAVTIFNSPSEVNRTRRSMSPLSQSPPGSSPRTAALAVEWAQLFEAEFGYMTDSWVWLFSEHHCRSQHPHTDYEVNSEWRRRAEAGYVMPLAAVFALEAETALHVWPGSHKPGVSQRIHPKRISLPPGTGTARASCAYILCLRQGR